MNKGILGTLLVAASATGFGALPFFALTAYGYGVTVPTLLAIRFAIASAFFFAVCLGSGKAHAIRPPGGTMALLGVLGVLYCVHSSLYLRAVGLIPPALAALIFYSYPVLVTLMSAVRERTRPTPMVTVSVITSSIGLLLVLGDGSLRGSNAAGILLASVTAVAYSVYVLVSGNVMDRLSPALASAYVSGFASVSLFALGLATGELDMSFPARAWLPILGMTLTSSVVGVYGLFRGIGIIGPARASVISTIEPVVTGLLGVLLLGQALAPSRILGGMFVLAGALLVTVRQVGVPSKD